MAQLKACPHCRHQVSERASKCLQCGSPLGHKTAKEAYISWSGLGLFDLIPGIRDLPYPVRFVIMVVVVLLVVVVVPLVLLVAVPLVNESAPKRHCSSARPAATFLFWRTPDVLHQPQRTRTHHRRRTSRGDRARNPLEQAGSLPRR